MPTNDAFGVVFLEQRLEGLGREAPVVGRVGVDVEVEGAGDEEGAARLEDAGHLGKAQPEAFDMLEGAERQHGAEGVVRERQALDIGDLIHALAGTEINAQKIFAPEDVAEVDHVLAIDLQGADLEDGFGQVEDLASGLDDAAQQTIHVSDSRVASRISCAESSYSRLKSKAAFPSCLTSQTRPELSGWWYL